MKKALIILFGLFITWATNAQTNIVFQHLNTSNGLSYIGVNDMCTDKKGNLWIATGNGLNMFNGKTTEKYFASEYPQLQNSNIIHVTCDSSNRVWILSANGNVTMLDEKRQFHHVGLYEKNERIGTRWILNALGTVLLHTFKGHYMYNDKIPLAPNDSLTIKHFTPLPIKGYDSLEKQMWNLTFYFDEETHLFTQPEVFYKISYKTKEVVRKYSIPHHTPLVKWAPDQLLAFNRDSHEAEVINLSTEEISYPFRGLTDQFGKPITAWIISAEKISDTKFLLTTLYEGIYIYDSQTKKIFNYRHNIADPSTIGNDIQSKLTVGKKGWIFITCNPNGISYFNVNDFIGSQSVFLDGHGRGFDGYVAGVATKDYNTYYVGTAEGILEWKRNTNETVFINPGENGKPAFKKEEVIDIAIDDNDRIWAGTVSNGIIVFDKNKKLVRHFKVDDNNKNGFKIRAINKLLSKGEYVWACGGNGICRININSFAIDSFKNTLLSQFSNKYCARIIFTDNDNLWFAAGGEGLFHYNLPADKMDTFSIKNGLLSNFVFDLNCDNEKNIYAGTISGLTIFYTNGKTKTITQKDGLLIDRAEGLMLDKHDRMWIGNDIGLACYDPKDSSLVTFDQRYGLSIFGFRVNSYFETGNGEFVFGTPRGLQYFHPDSLFNKKLTLNALINKIETKSIVSNITENARFDLPSSSNYVSFYFGSVDFTQHLRTYYQYQLTNIDKDWIKLADQNSVTYNALPPGRYTFKLRVSNDNKNWQNAENEVTITIAAPFYKTWWFKLAGILVGLGLIWIVLNYYRQKHKAHREKLEAEVVINYFASKINSHKKTDDLLWDVANNCISHLRFEDCVIYLLDEEKNILVQKAAHGPKKSIDSTTYSPIPVGKGIVGTVAQTGIAEIVNDTTDDKRYVADGQAKQSEITVPIFINEKVIGVIDSEHHKKNFFTQKHLQVLSTIAALCANQIQKTKAEEETQRATIELLQNKQKATESRLQSLRLQMNPHFLFNALNSIQQMILADEDMVATKYLSRFSKLLRAILVHSDKETISLKEELEILKLYVELESIRFKDSFQYRISWEETMDTDEIKIPTLLVQPFVENAIWHGLMHKEGEKILTVEFKEEPDFIKCIVEDNGIGRKKTSEIKTSTGEGKKHTSKGIEVSKERLKTLKTKNGSEGSIQIIDLVNQNGEPCGTRIEINFPIQN